MKKLFDFEHYSLKTLAVIYLLLCVVASVVIGYGSWGPCLLIEWVAR
ncbi:TPA: hypothetical protein R2K43_000831 [Raoultella planticola]|nr:hypothetical protein [Raoultella planticola]HEC2625673.1 hypothetical protein [Raoultella planticola]